jgi:hypothetical protein
VPALIASAGVQPSFKWSEDSRVADMSSGQSLANLLACFAFNGVDPHAYLTDVITKIVNRHPNSRIDELLPWVYAEPLKAVAGKPRLQFIPRARASFRA